MSDPLKSIHVRLSPEWLLGRVHTYTVTARRFQGPGFAGILGDLQWR